MSDQSRAGLGGIEDAIAKELHSEVCSGYDTPCDRVCEDDAYTVISVVEKWLEPVGDDVYKLRRPADAE